METTPPKAVSLSAWQQYPPSPGTTAGGSGESGCGDTTLSMSSDMNGEEGGNREGDGTVITTTATTDGNRGGITETTPPKAVSSSAFQQYHTRLSTLTWDYALWAIETAGPTYIKLVQWASTRHDLFSPEFVSHFTKLQDETRGHSWKETEMTLVRSFGKDWKNVLSFDKVIDDGICMDDTEGEDGALIAGDGIDGGRLKPKSTRHVLPHTTSCIPPALAWP
jgi:hypothetical protein